MNSFGKFIIILGFILIIIGLLIAFGGKFGFGRLPGDIYIDKGNFKFYFPITSSIIVSVIISIILKIINR